MKNTFLQLIVIVLMASCQPKHERLIDEYLNKHYTSYEIVEIKPDSANVYLAVNVLRSLQIQNSNTEVEFAKLYNSIWKEKNDEIAYKYYLAVDSVYQNAFKNIKKFDELKNRDVTPVFKVKYLIPIGITKREIEEYFYINPANDDIVRRNVNWFEFLNQAGFYDLERELNNSYRNRLEYSSRFKKFK